MSDKYNPPDGRPYVHPEWGDPLEPAPEPVTLTFPVGFDPLGMEDAAVAAEVRRLWVEAANRAFEEEIELMREAGPEDTQVFTREQLGIRHCPDDRPLDPRVVDQYAKDMLEGNWRLPGMEE